MATTTAVKDVRDLISEHLENFGIKQTWVADKIEISYPHFSLILKKERELTDDNLAKINEALNTKFKA